MRAKRLRPEKVSGFPNQSTGQGTSPRNQITAKPGLRE
ncbi:hypothetical protein Pan189_34020 [Stratiformator vulcanicus]|uniref:Uncharacterized protein n=1 Tax=Stratiformator vulcanicus TaxID=2527980 RepID=A0A517R535_9PLAN|nr:hypothetical protein Pan189_34020 [Stratiformator vulcanicus]